MVHYSVALYTDTLILVLVTKKSMILRHFLQIIRLNRQALISPNPFD